MIRTIDISHGCRLSRSSTHIREALNIFFNFIADPNFQTFSWWSDVNSFSSLDNQTEFGPTYQLEYSTREAYGGNITGFGPNDPLNATWWHLVTERKSHCILLKKRLLVDHTLYV